MITKLREQFDSPLVALFLLFLLSRVSIILVSAVCLAALCAMAWRFSKGGIDTFNFCLYTVVFVMLGAPGAVLFWNA